MERMYLTNAEFEKMEDELLILKEPSKLKPYYTCQRGSGPTKKIVQVYIIKV